MLPGLALTHSDSAKPLKSEKPMIKMLRLEFMSTYCRFEMPTATIIPAGEGCGHVCEGDYKHQHMYLVPSLLLLHMMTHTYSDNTITTTNVITNLKR